jgi:hypothetical protein
VFPGGEVAVLDAVRDLNGQASIQLRITIQDKAPGLPAFAARIKMLI